MAAHDQLALVAIAAETQLANRRRYFWVS